MQPDILIRNACEEDIPFVAGCVLAAVGLYDFKTASLETTIAEQVCGTDGTLYSYKNARIATRMRFHIWSSYYYADVLEYDQISSKWELDETTEERQLVKETLHVKETHDYEFHIYGIHEDLYRYMNNQIDRNDNDYGQQGLAPTVFNWTNVKDGFGIVAGMSHVSTGWFQFGD